MLNAIIFDLSSEGVQLPGPLQRDHDPALLLDDSRDVDVVGRVLLVAGELRAAVCERRFEKKIVVANPEDVKTTDTKSFPNVLLALAEATKNPRT